MTHLPAGCGLDDVIAFDTGPGNMLMDAVVTEITRGALTFDKDGTMGAKGAVSEELESELMGNPYLELAPPKSTGRELFGRHTVNQILTWRGKISDEDLVATLTSFTARSVVDAMNRFVLSRGTVDEILVSGGGSKNPCLMKMLRMAQTGIGIHELETLGMPSEAKEAVAFAVLANETISGNQGNVPGATGAAHSVVLGVIAPGSGARFSVD